jgi:hypothetical protein
VLLQQVDNHAKEFEDHWNAERQDRFERVRHIGTPAGLINLVHLRHTYS